MDNVDIIIGKYLSGNIGEDELEELFQWVNSSAENEEYFCECKNIWVAANISVKDVNVNIDDEFALLQAKLKSEDKLEPAVKIGPVKKFISIWQNVAAVLILPVCIAGLLIYFDKDASTDIAKANVVIKEMFTPKGVRAKLELADGTDVWLNSNSKIKYSSEFDGETRNVEITGEAFFDVAHDKNRPFIISARGLKLKVLGTSFNVNTYDENKIETTLVNGSVELSGHDQMGEPVLLKPGYQAVFHDKSGEIPVSKVKTRYLTAWKDGNILLCDTPMADVITTLERWYGVEVSVTNKSIYKYRFTASLKDKTLSEVLDLLKMSSPLGYKINGKKVVIYYKKK